MFFKILLASLSFILISIQVTAFRKYKDHADLNQSIKRVKSKGYDQGGASSSKSNKKLKLWKGDYKNEDYASSSNNGNNDFGFNEEIRNALSGSDGFLSSLGTNTLGQATYLNQYGSLTPQYQENEQFSLVTKIALEPLETKTTCNANDFYRYAPRPPQNQEIEPNEQYLKSCVNELVRFLELEEYKAPEGEDDDDDVPPQIIQPQTDLAPGEHNFVRIEGRSNARRVCQQHRKNFKTAKTVMTKCDTCHEMLCRDCHMYKHGLPRLPDIPQITFPENLKCVFCGQSIVNTESTLANHLLKCENTPDGFYSCCACGRPFSKVYSYELHLRTHSGERPYVCEICEEGFTSKPNLKRHKSTLHKESTQRQSKDAKMIPDERPYVCEEGFTKKSNFRRHKCTSTLYKKSTE